ncbi:putative tail protein [Ruegeria phage vB_RpoS-V16]|uniref:putative tail protein n=1 Tax=Ruegeria phage vB_RpoS-V16 TaxID=2218618 RepID=UPI000DCADDDB|nr:putative tail protein [Ruegeria phage vB_RpoS-V16]AWY09481.1 putative tail protein [Ruegeria phage vB_RpoS-V16]
MAGEITLPNVGLTAFWNLGDNSYKDGMDLNLTLMSVLAQAAILSQEAAVPGVPVAGGVYLATTDWSATVTTNSLQVYLNTTGFAPAATPPGVTVRNSGEWIEIVPQEGWTLYDRSANKLITFDGAAWVDTVPASTLPDFTGNAGKHLAVNGTEDGTEWVDASGSAISISQDTATNHAVTDADLAGNKLLKMNNAAANTVTVPSGLTGTEPLTIVQTGAGQTTIVAGGGVTVSSLGGLLAISGQYGSATLIPNGADSYLLIGALA